jgi:hypothetical protein
MLPLLTRLRIEERERWRAMGDEVEDLRIRIWIQIRIRGPAPSTRGLRLRDTRILLVSSRLILSSIDERVIEVSAET